MATMGTSLAAAPPQSRPLEDPLAHLPCSTVVRYRKGQTIYSHDQPSTSIYLVIGGKVKVCRLAGDGRQVVIDIYRPDEVFGESAFVGDPERTETSVAVEDAELMTWTTAEIERLAVLRPMLAIALLQLVAQRSMDFGNRIESFSLDNTARRLARALIRFSERLGHEAEDGSAQMIPMTHELLSQYVGTSREIVTNYMIQFRRQGYLRYSRQRIVLRRDAILEWLRQESGSPKQQPRVAASTTLCMSALGLEP
jgi:CRP/FNR family transcriptional regulator, cyclic AMP receptor protein